MLRRSSCARPPEPPNGPLQVRIFNPLHDEQRQRDDSPSIWFCAAHPLEIQRLAGYCSICRAELDQLSRRDSLRQFFETWLLPALLRKARSPTIRKYQDAIAWWEAITNNPSMGEITDAVCKAFADELPEAKYRRAAVRRGATVQRATQSGSGLYRTLAPISVAKHVNRIAFILGRAGPRFDPREPVAELLERCPLMPRLEADWESKPPFDLEVARAIAAASKTFDRPATPEWITPPQYWRVQLAQYFYTGLRSGTVLALRVKHFEDKAKVPILNVPGDIVFKTSKPIQVAVHPQLAKILREVTRDRDPHELILPPTCSYSHLLDLHESLQRLAGLEKSQVQSIHAWRRTHGNQMAMLGADDGIKIAQAALDHADERTTRKSYVNQTFLNGLRVKLPELWPRTLFD